MSYLIKDFTDAGDNGDNPPPELIEIYHLENLLKYLSENKNREICVYEIGNCLLDWS